MTQIAPNTEPGKAEPAKSEAAKPAPESRNLVTRIVAAVVLVPVALAAAWFGGPLWLMLALAVSFGLFAEWLMITQTWKRSIASAGALALAFAATALSYGRADVALLAILLGITVTNAMLPREQRWWAAGGLLYAGTALAASAILRADPAQGFAAILLVFGIVWATDIMGYAFGRTIGGPKLAPRISPKKTWSGAIGSIIGSLAVGVAFALAGFGAMKPVLVIALLLSVVSQLGDLFESAIKRRFGVKDSSHIIPGHGGLLDRLDGFVFAVAAAAAIGAARGGFDHAADGLLNW